MTEVETTPATHTSGSYYDENLGLDPTNSHDSHDDADDDEYSHEDEHKGRKPWDEGGQSDCGYSDSVHGTLMHVGKSAHTVVGEPNERVGKVLHAIGQWFQEASYAVRDYWRGNDRDSMHEDASKAIKTMFSGGETSVKDEEKEAEEQEQPVTAQF